MYAKNTDPIRQSISSHSKLDAILLLELHIIHISKPEWNYLPCTVLGHGCLVYPSDISSLSSGQPLTEGAVDFVLACCIGETAFLPDKLLLNSFDTNRLVEQHQTRPLSAAELLKQFPTLENTAI
jgi:hypothetical protein